MKMEDICCLVGAEEEEVELPAGFRFHPTDEELISHYLHPKAVDPNFSARAIGEVDLNKCEPWELPKRAKMGETEWYFFWLKDRKYPTGLRTNRATEAGYWKATGKDKHIYKGNSLVGMKKTLVFYKGRAPKGHKSNWVMHEYRLDGKLSPLNLSTSSSSSKNEWVISRTFLKSSSGKKIPFPASLELPSLVLPPLMDSSPYTDTPSSSRHVSCFSSPIAPQGYSRSEDPIPFTSHQFNLFSGESQYPTGVWHESDILSSILEGNGVSVSHDTCLSNYELGRGPFDEGPSTFGGPVDTESIWDIIY